MYLLLVDCFLICLVSRKYPCIYNKGTFIDTYYRYLAYILSNVLFRFCIIIIVLLIENIKRAIRENE